MTAMSTAAPGFASLAELQANHAALAKEVGKDILVPANTERIVQFVRRGIATGAVLDAPNDRAAAQSLISFWTNRLASVSRDLDKESSPAQVPEFEDTLLAEFNSDALVAAVITPTDEWLDRQSPTDQTLARRLVLRLVTLREDGSFEVVLSASGVSEDLAPQDRAEEVLAELVRLGLVRSKSQPFGIRGIRPWISGTTETLAPPPGLDGRAEAVSRKGDAMGATKSRERGTSLQAVVHATR